MSTAERVRLARDAVRDHPLPLVLSALQLPRSTWYYHWRARRDYGQKWAHLRRPLESIARRNPEYGYRRAAVELRERYGEHRSPKVVQRLHRLWELPLLRGAKRPKPSGIRQAIRSAGDRANLLLDHPQPFGAFEVLYTDFTELVYAQGRRKAFLIPILDHATKLVLGAAVGPRAVTPLALEAWKAAARRLARFGLSTEERIVHHDQDPVFTSYAWTARLLLDDGCRLSFALNGAPDNPEMESFFGRFKIENRSLLLEAESLADLTRVVRRRIDHYNRRRRHSSIDYRYPLQHAHTLLKEGDASQS
jgi:putative transposase